MSLTLVHAGKVRELYDAGDDRLVMVATDRISAFDVILEEPIPDKGRVLTAMTVHWLDLLADLVPSHLVSADPADLPPDAALIGGDAGLAAMTELIPSTASPVHFLVPLPGGISPSALDLFGFWTYELRCGHLQWSTAQGRFGRPLRVAGVQHPCPPLTVNVERVTALPTTGGAAQPCISATADLAQTVLDDVSLTLPAAPQTQIWFLLYAQLLRADGEVWRNLLLAKLAGVQPEVNQTFIAPPSQQQSIPVTAAFAQSAIDDILFTLRLPANTPLSVLAVELFNKESLVIQDNYYYPEISALPAGLSASVLKAGGVVGGSPSGALAAPAGSPPTLAQAFDNVGITTAAGNPHRDLLSPATRGAHAFGPPCRRCTRPSLSPEAAGIDAPGTSRGERPSR